MKTFGKVAMLWFLLSTLATGFAWAGFLDSMQPVTVTVNSNRATPSKHPALQWPEMTPEKAFYYYCAIYGTPNNAIDRYGSYFDAPNYTKAMADEFQRAKYRERIQAKIANEIKKLNFNDKFTVVGSTAHEGYTSLGEYSFGSHSFPISSIPTIGFCIDAGRTFFGNCLGTVLHVDVFRRANAANSADFNWSLPMSETEASAFVKSRAVAGGVNRRVAAKITYSIMNMKGELDDSSHGKAATFIPFIYAVEIYTDESLSKKLGVVSKINSLGANTAEALRLEAVAAQTVTTEIGRYLGKSFVVDKPDGKIHNPFETKPPLPRWSRKIILTDIGVTLLDERTGVSPETQRFNFFDSPMTTLWRANESEYWDSIKQRVELKVGVHERIYSVVWRNRVGPTSFRFDSQQERDRFFVDLSRTFQKWKTRYAPFQFAAGELTIEQRCEVGTRFAPCPSSTPSTEEFTEEIEESSSTEQTPSVTAPAPATTEPVSLEKLSETITRGETAVLKVKCNFASPGYVFLRDGVLTLSKTGIKLSLPIGKVDYGFTVASDKILEVTQQPQHIRLRVAKMTYDRKWREEKRDYDLYNSNAVTVDVGPDGRILSYGTANIACDDCDNTMSVLYALLEKVREGNK